MIAPNHRKVTPRHLSRKAWLYVRQSTLRQVVENTESTENTEKTALYAIIG